MSIVEYRGVEGLVYAPVLEDTEMGYLTGEVKRLAGVAEISKTTESAVEPKYYDNHIAFLINTSGADEVTCTVSAIPLDVLGEITGQIYDPETGALIEKNREPRYFALGYKTKRTDNAEIYVWRYKGTFNVPDSTHAGEHEDSNGQEIVYTGISTNYSFLRPQNRIKGMAVNTSLGTTDISTFFDKVTSPDSLQNNLPWRVEYEDENGYTGQPLTDSGNSVLYEYVYEE